MPDDFFKKLAKFGKINYGTTKVHLYHMWLSTRGKPTIIKAKIKFGGPYRANFYPTVPHSVYTNSS
jgi:hypothetical protein